MGQREFTALVEALAALANGVAGGIKCRHVGQTV